MTRREIEALIQRAIDVLDEMDGDADRELTGDDEPDEEREPDPGYGYSLPAVVGPQDCGPVRLGDRS